MSTILEALQNADYNLQHNGIIGVVLAKEQLHNSVVLLDLGYDLNTEIEQLLNKYDKIEDVPKNKENQNETQSS